jgi:hypothetical protein
MKLSKLVPSAFAVAVLSVAGASSASDIVNHGGLCNVQPLDVSKVEYSQFGPFNNSTTSAAALGCGAATPILATINTVQAIVYDRNSSAGQFVSCTLVLTDIFGSSLFTQTQSSTSPGTGFQTLTWNPGVGTHTLYLGCSLPAKTAAGVSHFTTYRVITP